MLQSSFLPVLESVLCSLCTVFYDVRVFNAWRKRNEGCPVCSTVCEEQAKKSSYQNMEFFNTKLSPHSRGSLEEHWLVNRVVIVFLMRMIMMRIENSELSFSFQIVANVLIGHVPSVL